jgi:hypothetical protein
METRRIYILKHGNRHCNAMFRVCIQQSVYCVFRGDYNEECPNLRELITGIHGLTAMNFDYINV